MRAFDLIGAFIHSIIALIGVAGCLLGFAALPGLFNLSRPEDLLFVVFDIPFSKGILDAFPFHWQIVILAGGVFLFAWLCFLFLFSSHITITTLTRTLKRDSDGSGPAWGAVLFLGSGLATCFVVLLYGIEVNQQTIVVGLLLMAIMGYLFAANYTVSDEGEPHVISYS